MRKDRAAGGRSGRVARGTALGMMGVVLGMWMSGCQSGPERTADTDAALNDPFGYKVDVPDNVSGGKIHELDKKGLQGDLDRLMNP